tara:strand:- start:98573 stop:98779 length:207 start_codon:yes stop_codon:yes gene_type:complete
VKLLTSGAFYVGSLKVGDEFWFSGQLFWKVHHLFSTLHQLSQALNQGVLPLLGSGGMVPLLIRLKSAA